mgnify:FL=1
MKDYEDSLQKGEWLDIDERLSLYIYLKSKNKKIYSQLKKELQQKGSAFMKIANAEIRYELNDQKIINKTRQIGTSEYVDGLREIKLSKFSALNNFRLNQFFAQCEVDAIWNFPIEGKYTKSSNGYGINTYPYYDLNYYSNGEGKLRGLISKIKG